jgi:mRNA interferase RelE/StbE
VKYQVSIDRSAKKKLRQIPEQMRRRLFEKVFSLQDNPRHPGVKALKGSLKGAWRVRVGDHRILFRINDALAEVDVFDIDLRAGVYDQ